MWRRDRQQRVGGLRWTAAGSEDEFVVQVESGVVVDGEVVDEVGAAPLMRQVSEGHRAVDRLSPVTGRGKLEINTNGIT